MNQETKKMTKKEKKVYEAPMMTVYEIGRTQILAGSDTAATTTEGYSESDFNWE